MEHYNLLTEEQYLNNQEGVYIDEDNNEAILQVVSEFGDAMPLTLTKNDLLTILNKLK